MCIYDFWLTGILSHSYVILLTCAFATTASQNVCPEKWSISDSGVSSNEFWKEPNIWLPFFGWKSLRYQEVKSNAEWAKNLLIDIKTTVLIPYCSALFTCNKYTASFVDRINCMWWRAVFLHYIKMFFTVHNSFWPVKRKKIKS